MKRILPFLAGGLAATAIGAFTALPLANAATSTPTTVTTQAAQKAIGLVGGSKLVKFSLGTPTGYTTVGNVSGLQTDTRIAGIDYRVQDQKLYAVGDAGGVYTVSTTTGVATFINRVTVPFTGTISDIDFNPAADRLRIVTSAGENLRHNVNNAAAPAAPNTPATPTVTDGALTYVLPPAAPVPATSIAAVAYINNDVEVPPVGTPASSNTAIFGLDTAADQIALQSPANAGLLVPTGRLGIDAGSAAGLDIYSARTKGRAVTNVAYATLQVNGIYGLYKVDLLTGLPTLVGRFGAALPVADLAVLPVPTA